MNTKWDHGWPTQPAPEEPRQLGHNFVDHFDVYRTIAELTPEQVSRVRMSAARVAARDGWSSELGEVLSMLGCEQ